MTTESDLRPGSGRKRKFTMPEVRETVPDIKYLPSIPPKSKPAATQGQEAVDWAAEQRLYRATYREAAKQHTIAIKAKWQEEDALKARREADLRSGQEEAEQAGRCPAMVHAMGWGTRRIEKHVCQREASHGGRCREHHLMEVYRIRTHQAGGGRTMRPFLARDIPWGQATDAQLETLRCLPVRTPLAGCIAAMNKADSSNALTIVATKISAT